MTIKLTRQAGLKLGSGVRLGGSRPDFDSLFDPAAQDLDNPLDELAYPDEPEAAADAEVSEALRLIREQKRARRDAYRTLVDTEYWLCVCFQNREQKEAFLQAVGWDDLGDKYLDGLQVAKRCGVAIAPIDLRAKPARPAPKALREEILSDA